MITWKLSDIQDIPKQAGIYQIKNVLNGHSYKNGIEKIYSSITEAAKDTGNINNKSAISDCLRGRRKTAYGSKWRYYND